MSTNQIGGNPAVDANGNPVTTVATTQQSTGLAATNMNVPEFMLSIPKEELGTELMRQYVSPPRMKIVQGQSGQELKRLYGESSVVVTPDNVMVTPPIDFKSKQESSNPIKVVPIFFYPEFCLFNPMGVTPYCKDRSIDATSPIGLRCKGQFDKRSIPCPEDPKLFCKYQEVLNFIVYVWAPDVYKDPVLVSMKSSDFTTGRNWCKLATIPRNVPCYGQVFELSCSPRAKDKNEWYGWDVRHATTPEGMIEFVGSTAKTEEERKLAEEWFYHLREVHAQFVDNYKSGLLQANYDDDIDEDAGRAATASASNVGM